MKLNLRTRLTLWYMLAFLIAFLIVLGTAALTFRHLLYRNAKKALKVEEAWVTHLFEAQFRDIQTATGEQYEALVDELLEELQERHGLKHQFAIIGVQTLKGFTIFSGGVKNIQLLLPKGFLKKPTSHKSMLLGNRHYRVRVVKKPWGALAVGVEDETFYRVAEESTETLVWLIPSILLVISLVGWLLAKLAMRPVALAAKAADSISVTNLQQRLPNYTGHDEFGTLIATFNRMISRLEQGVLQLQQFTQDAAHELRTPLTIVRGELEMAYQQTDISDNLRRVLQTTLDRVIELSEIVENLLLLTRTDNHAHPLNKTRFRLDNLVRELFEDTQVLAENRPIEVHLQHCDEIEFTGDKNLIHRLILNLCDNAVKYTTRGHITLSLLNLDHAVEFKISDSGKGIPPEDLPHIFDRFYRVDKSRASGSGGSGLGLAICKWIVQAHGGEIDIQSEIGKGTTVRVVLPI